MTREYLTVEKRIVHDTAAGLAWGDRWQVRAYCASDRLAAEQLAELSAEGGDWRIRDEAFQVVRRAKVS